MLRRTRYTPPGRWPGPLPAPVVLPPAAARGRIDQAVAHQHPVDRLTAQSRFALAGRAGSGMARSTTIGPRHREGCPGAIPSAWGRGPAALLLILAVTVRYGAP